MARHSEGSYTITCTLHFQINKNATALVDEQSVFVLTTVDFSLYALLELFKKMSSQRDSQLSKQEGNSGILVYKPLHHALLLDVSLYNLSIAHHNAKHITRGWGPPLIEKKKLEP